ncbi:ATP-binding protein [uncultured Alistipes sp.]|uniref:ATP-binding protein n=2 Tax=uncultured Alistipes sp. TaxID=538949 RepID=UPI0011DDF60F|nr:ATP-binding protein [uncultured Alistipes sp.]
MIRWRSFLPLLWAALATSPPLVRAGLLPVSDRRVNYSRFERVEVSVEASCVHAMLQDVSGLMWICTDKGLYNYDGYRAVACHARNDLTRVQTHCAAVIGERIWTGTDRGVLVYDIRRDRYVADSLLAGQTVRSILHAGGAVWMGCSQGVWRYDPKCDRLDRVRVERGHEEQGVYSLHADRTGLYAGMFDGLYRYDEAAEAFVRLGPAQTHSLFVYAICPDPLRGCLYLGTQQGLWRYEPGTGLFRSEGGLRHAVINDVAVDRDGVVVLGSDAGLILYDGRTMRTLTHDARSDASLSHDDIESLRVDRAGNVWIGTHDGISLARYGQTGEKIALSEFTGSGYGMTITAMMQDSRGALWCGGPSGVLHVAEEGTSCLHHIRSERHPLPHNCVHSFYEDGAGEVWAATDGGALRYDRPAGRFVAYPVETDRYNAEWCYTLAEDGRGRIWIGTFSAGIFLCDRARLLREGVGRPERNLAGEIRNGSVFRMLRDARGCIWALYYDKGLDRIDPEGAVEHYDLARYIGTQVIPTDMALDDAGFLWAGFLGGVLRIDTRTGEALRLDFPEGRDSEVLAVGCSPEAAWITTTDGRVWCVDRRRLAVEPVPVPLCQYPSVCYERTGDCMLLGCVDGVLRIPLPFADPSAPPCRPILTSLSVDGRPWAPVDGGGEPLSIRYAERIDLPHDRNDLELRFASMNFGPRGSEKYAYRLDPADGDWSPVAPDANGVSLLNVAPGNYRLEVCMTDRSGHPVPGTVRALRITVRPPLYRSAGAVALYLCLAAGAAVAAAAAVQRRDRRRRERFERETLLAQAKAKADFLLEVSHDLKAPLGLILGPVSRLLFAAGDEPTRRQLDLVRRNAERIGLLVNRVFDPECGDGAGDSLLLSTVDVAELFAAAVLRYRQAAEDRSIETRTCIEPRRLFRQCDAYKIGSIFDNLLSNAYKYVRRGGRVDLSLSLSAQSGCVRLIVADDGIGIPASDRPYVFQRFFQSSLTRGSHAGTGMGLYLVRKYVALHGGTVELTSKEGSGTTAIVELPLAAAPELPDAPAAEVAAPDEAGTAPAATAAESVAEPAAEAMSHDERFLAEVTQLVEREIDSSELTVASLAARAGTSPKQLYRRLKALTGCTPVDYIRTIRIKRAAIMLSQGRFTVQEVMYSVGFSDHSYFARCFRAEFGCTPSQFLKNRPET